MAANSNQQENLAEARRRLSEILFSPHYTPELWTEPYGSSAKGVEQAEGQASCTRSLYLNQLVEAQTALSCEALVKQLKAIEQAMGRTPEQRQQGIVCIDLDLMAYDRQRHHLTDWERPYVKNLTVYLCVS